MLCVCEQKDNLLAGLTGNCSINIKIFLTEIYDLIFKNKFRFAPMLKSIIAVTLSFVLIFSILGPIVLKLYTSDFSAIALVEIIEEEQQKKTGSEIEDVKIFEKSYAASNSLNNLSDKSLSKYYQNITSGDFLEIQLRPPRYNV